MYVCMYMCVYVCVYVCMYMYVYYVGPMYVYVCTHVCNPRYCHSICKSEGLSLSTCRIAYPFVCLWVLKSTEQERLPLLYPLTHFPTITLMPRITSLCAFSQTATNRPSWSSKPTSWIARMIMHIHYQAPSDLVHQTLTSIRIWILLHGHDFNTLCKGWILVNRHHNQDYSWQFGLLYVLRCGERLRLLIIITGI